MCYSQKVILTQQHIDIFFVIFAVLDVLLAVNLYINGSLLHLGYSLLCNREVCNWVAPDVSYPLLGTLQCIK